MEIVVYWGRVKAFFLGEVRGLCYYAVVLGDGVRLIARLPMRLITPIVPYKE